MLAYAASYFARGFLAGHRRFGLYGGLVLMEASSRCLFALAVAVGIAEGQTAVALGMAAAPIVSLSVVPWALGAAAGAAPGGGGDPRATPPRAVGREPEFTLAHGSGFAAAVLLIMLCEQTFLNAGPLLVKATEGAPRRRARGLHLQRAADRAAPLQLFQAVQTSILPHLTRLRAGGETDPFRRSVNLTLVAIAGFATCVALGLLVDRPARDGAPVRRRLRLRARRARAGRRSAWASTSRPPRSTRPCWRTRGRRRRRPAGSPAAAGFVLFLVLAEFDDRVLQVELAFLGAAACLSASLYALYRRA